MSKETNKTIACYCCNKSFKSTRDLAKHQTTNGTYRTTKILLIKKKNKTALKLTLTFTLTITVRLSLTKTLMLSLTLLLKLTVIIIFALNVTRSSIITEL